MKQRILPAISNYKSLEKFLKTDITYCVILNFPLIQLKRVCQMLHQGNKKCIVHLDLVKGIANNEYGAEFLIEAFNIEGIISTHPSAIEMAKKRNMISIMRIFIIDSQSLAKSMSIAKRCQPDYIELLPGYSYEVAGEIRKFTDTPLIGGGLISTEDMVEKCLANGLVAVTSSDVDLWRLA